MSNYTCAICGGIFELQETDEWNSDKAKDELKETFGDISTDECDLVCDECYKELEFGV